LHIFIEKKNINFKYALRYRCYCIAGTPRLCFSPLYFYLNRGEKKVHSGRLQIFAKGCFILADLLAPWSEDENEGEEEEEEEGEESRRIESPKGQEAVSSSSLHEDREKVSQSPQKLKQQVEAAIWC
jgi:hypothetical protein